MIGKVVTVGSRFQGPDGLYYTNRGHSTRHTSKAHLITRKGSTVAKIYREGGGKQEDALLSLWSSLSTHPQGAVGLIKVERVGTILGERLAFLFFKMCVWWWWR